MIAAALRASSERGGDIVTSHRIDTFAFRNLYNTKHEADRIRMVLEGIYVLMLLGYLVNSFKYLRKRGAIRYIER